MSAPSKVNKENFRLLDLSSDEESEDLQLEIIPSRKKKITRRERSRSSAPAALEHNIGTEVRCALRWAVRGTLLLWLLMLTWICAALYDQVTTMRVEIGHAAVRITRVRPSKVFDRLRRESECVVRVCADAFAVALWCVMESAVHAAVPLRVGKKMRKRRELDALVGGGGSRGGRLLSASSDEGEPWGRRTSRRRRSRPFVRLAAALAFCVCVVSAATVLWLFVDVRRQIASLRIEMDRVSRSSNSVDDALQVCHTTAKELRANASALSEKFAQLDLEHKELSQRVAQAAQDLAVVSNQLSAAPKLADTPRRLAELQRTVATFGSQINGFDSSISSTHKQALAAVAGVEEIRTLLHQLDAKANETIANITANTKRDEDLRSDVGSLNTTLTSKIEALQIRIQEISPVSTVPPTVPTAATAGSTAAVVNATSTTTTSVPPGKPAVLQ
ncbi:hypothetical protein B5X24_HaOG206932 [Helicoverpa armigera]|nr:hypothetical protein B5X24_HaOG206932 [Helicoverpa armigera]